jgi:NAD(P)-dependent dehydrogenase (short-subunit alcohol dehydrogenase family)
VVLRQNCRVEQDFAGHGVALVTGGSGAIGAAVTKTLAVRGSRVVYTYLSNEEAAAALNGEAEEQGWEIEGRRLDLRDAAATACLLTELEAQFGGIHTVVYASGPFVQLDYLSRVTPQRFREQLEADAVAFFNLVQPAIQPLRRTRGSIVAVATTALSRAISRDGLSAGPKGAVEGVVRTLALEEGRYGIRANVVGVGVTDVGMAADLIESGAFGEAGLAEATARIPLRHFGTAEDLAEAVCFLASDRARFITGQTLNVDGGYSV